MDARQSGVAAWLSMFRNVPLKTAGWIYRSMNDLRYGKRTWGDWQRFVGDLGVFFVATALVYLLREGWFRLMELGAQAITGKRPIQRKGLADQLVQGAGRLLGIFGPAGDIASGIAEIALAAAKGKRIEDREVAFGSPIAAMVQTGTRLTQDIIDAFNNRLDQDKYEKNPNQWVDRVIAAIPGFMTGVAYATGVPIAGAAQITRSMMPLPRNRRVYWAMLRDALEAQQDPLTIFYDDKNRAEYAEQQLKAMGVTDVEIERWKRQREGEPTTLRGEDIRGNAREDIRGRLR